MNIRKVIIPLLLLFAGFAHLAGQDIKDKKLSSLGLVTAVQYINDAKYSEAYNLLTQVQKLDPDNDAAYFYIGRIAQELKDGQTAMENFSKAYQLDSTNIWYGQALANILYLTNRSEQAVELYSKLMEQRPNDPQLIGGKLDACLMCGEFETADSLLTRLETINGKSDYSELTRLEILRQKGEFTAFFGAMKKYFREGGMSGEQKKDMISCMLRGSDPRFNYLHLQDYEELTQICLDVHPEDTAVAHFAGSFLFSIDRKDKALEICNNWPQDSLMVELGVSIYYSEENYKAALQQAEKLMSIAKSDEARLVAHIVKGDCYQALGQMDKVYREYDAALQIDPDNATVLNNYAYHLVCEGKNINKAAKMSRKAVEQNPENASFLDTFAWIMHKQKKYQVAKAYFKKAMLYGGKDSEVVLEHYAATLEALGETTLAKAYREQAALKRNAKK